MARNTSRHTEATASRLTESVESSIKNDNSSAYSNAMDEVNSFQRNHSAKQYNAMVSSMTGSLRDDQYLQRMGLMEAKNSFAKIDTDRDGNLSSSEVTNFNAISRNSRSLNRRESPAQSALGDVEKRFDQIGHKEGIPFMKSTVINKQDLDKHLDASNKLVHLFEKGKDGVSLYDRVSDKAGNIPNISGPLGLDKNNGSIMKFSAEDRATIQFLQSQREWKSMAPGTNDMREQHLKDLFQAEGLDYDKMRSQAEEGKHKGGKRRGSDSNSGNGSDSNSGNGSDSGDGNGNGRDGNDNNERADESGTPETRSPRDRSNEPGSETERDRAEALREAVKDALTVRRGQSYCQAAERLLALSGITDPTGKQIHRLEHQLWVADNRRPAYGLTTGQVLEIDAHIRANADVAALFR